VARSYSEIMGTTMDDPVRVENGYVEAPVGARFYYLDETARTAVLAFLEET